MFVRPAWDVLDGPNGAARGGARMVLEGLAGQLHEGVVAVHSIVMLIVVVF